MEPPKQPPLDGSIPALPGFVDFHATHNPNRQWALLAPESGSEVKSITFLEFADATHRVAHLLRPDPSESKREVVALLIHCDTILYLALMVGLIRAGFTPFPMSPRNSVPAVVNLLEKTSCHRIITQHTFQPVVSSVLEELSIKNHHLQVDDIPDVFSIFPSLTAQSTPVAPYPPLPTPFDLDEVLLILHSSGSTGLPKPVPQKHVHVLEWCRTSVIYEGGQVGVVWGSMALPTFHVMGMCLQFYAPLVGGYPVALYYPRSPLSPLVPTPQNMIEGCKITGASGVPMVPTFVEICAQNEDDLRYLASVKLVMYAGGPLSQKTGDKLAMAGAKFFPVYGSTEGGVNTRVYDIDYAAGPDAPVKSKEDWAWLSLMETNNPRWVPQGDGTYELHLLTCKTHNPAIENISDVRGYATNDLFVPHPTKKGLWRITGRKDDVLVLGSGEKVVPIPQEGMITSSPLASGAVMFGYGKNQCGVLVEPSPESMVDPSDLAALIDFRNKIWPIVEEANHIAPTFARVFKEMILVTDPARPLPRAAKSTIIRKQALALYAAEIEKLYETVQDSSDAKGIQLPDSWSIEDVEAWLIQHCVSINGGEDVSPTMDLFDQGFDSLHATFLRNRVIASLRSADDDSIRTAAQNISQNIVYEHPTLSELATALVALVNPSSAAETKDRLRHIADMIHKFSADIPSPNYNLASSSGPITVLLTGSTGNVGSHILVALLAEPRVEKVYTLSRPASQGEDRQRAAFVERGLPEVLLDTGKLVSFVGDPNQPELGLKHEDFVEILQSLTHVIHNAWRVDFNRSLSSFESQISGTRKLVDLCANNPRPIQLFFTSSISSAQGWHISNGMVPEEPLTDPAHTSAIGYGASKFVTENVLGKAAQHGVPCTSLRVGQVCGANSSGAWATTEWVPIMLKSSVTLKALPSLEGNVSWIPMDALAGAVVDLVVTHEPLPPLLNVVHPRRASWNALVTAFNSCLEEALPVVPFAEWVAALEHVAERGRNADVADVPAIRLLSFFRGVGAAADHATGVKGALAEAGGQPVFATEKLQRLCPSITDLGPLDRQYVKAWVSYWKRTGFLSS